MSRLAILVNNEGYPFGAFSIEEGSGGDRLVDVIRHTAPLFDLHVVLSTSDTAFAIYPKHLHDEVGKFISERTGNKPLDRFKSPARG